MTRSPQAPTSQAPSQASAMKRIPTLRGAASPTCMEASGRTERCPSECRVTCPGGRLSESGAHLPAEALAHVERRLALMAGPSPRSASHRASSVSAPAGARKRAALSDCARRRRDLPARVAGPALSLGASAALGVPSFGLASCLTSGPMLPGALHHLPLAAGSIRADGNLTPPGEM
jgi:hypothetical protein